MSKANSVFLGDTKFIVAAALSPALFLAGCGGSSTSTGSSHIPTPAVLTASAVSTNGLTGTLAQAAGTVPVGGGLLYTLTLTNTTGQPVVIHTSEDAVKHQPSVPVSMEIKDPAGKIIPSQAAASAVPTFAVDVTLQPGQVMKDVATVKAFQTVGLYTVTATFITGRTATGDVELSVGPLTAEAK